MRPWSERAPLFEAIAAYQSQTVGRFHVPGHKARPEAFGPGASYYQGLLPLDVTELRGLDDLHHPEEAIHEAQQLAADCFGAEETFFLVNGSTVGNQAMIAAVCRPGDLLLVQRDAHKSVIHGLMLAGAHAVFVHPRIDERTGLRGGIALEDVEEALRLYPQAKGLLLTCPSYYGIGPDLESIAELLHARHKCLLVDEAHGAHYGFHPELPGSALSCGADAVVQSTHKMLTALTMGSMLHVQGQRVSREILRRILGMLQSSSPSYPIMASLDLSRRYLQEQGTGAITSALAVLESWRSGIARRPRWSLARISGPYRSDPFKQLLYDAAGKLNGYELQAKLEESGCYAEMADAGYVVLAFSLVSRLEEVHHLLEALDRIAQQEQPDDASRPSSGYAAEATGIRQGASFRERISQPVPFSIASIHGQTASRLVPLDSCEGHMAAEMIVPYPPGIPLLYPGERITPQIAADLRLLAGSGARFQGHNVTELGTIPVRSSQLAEQETFE
ncbi:Arginine/lysine/ornithine decarboxylase [Paenibacillus sp. UNCCL117]|uniref:aminotransferase class I/II-fold pyridoxal phosphate-dependent enzyme n=1 Tax=unclassified Paenibacillus TaxID=185978 RepID=UPI0008885153|nr:MULTISPECIES: aminotransferase class I/II-fold pyridoxal phosphate-dependent enzyme [unclassified Paenibacillus]SDE52893.1 Arginine/lysine/ornithine decarboxylase [Paenibacillus sp. cl123]SFW67921.1 Arginine/lysine/ornithine decarboxylase [Paenibacillus sp. UNCCL117]